MVCSHLEYSFSPWSPEIRYDKYSPDNEQEKRSAAIGRISLQMASEQSEYHLGETLAVFWHALEYIEWDLEAYPICQADGTQLNFYFSDKKQMHQLKKALSLVKGFAAFCGRRVDIQCFYSLTESAVLRNTFYNVLQQESHNLHVMNPDFMSAVRTAQYTTSQGFSSKSYLYKSSATASELENPKSVISKHGIAYYHEIESEILPFIDPDFLVFSQQSEAIPLGELAPLFPQEQSVILKVDMNSGSQRVLQGEVPRYMTNGVVSDVLHFLPVDAHHGDIHEEAYFGYIPWYGILALLELPERQEIVSLIHELLKSYNYKLIAYPAKQPMVYEGRKTGKHTVSYLLNEPAEQGLERLAKLNKRNVAYIPGNILVR